MTARTSMKVRSAPRLVETIDFSVCYESPDGQVVHAVLSLRPGVLPQDVLAEHGISGPVLSECLGTSPRD